VVDVVIYCTGYRISFPFLGGAFGGPICLYRRVVPPNLPGLYFIGLVQPIGAVMPIAEIQSQWVADLLAGRAALPPEPEMNREIARYRTATAKRYRRPAEQAIQVDFLAYIREIRRERRAGARRNGTSRAITASPPRPRGSSSPPGRPAGTSRRAVEAPPRPRAVRLSH
jgi:hypothetical protein